MTFHYRGRPLPYPLSTLQCGPLVRRALCFAPRALSSSPSTMQSPVTGRESSGRSSLGQDSGFWGTRGPSLGRPFVATVPEVAASPLAHLPSSSAKARMVAAATNNLCEAANAAVQGHASEEKLISSAKQVAASTAQLLVACKVKADQDSEAMKRLQVRRQRWLRV